MEISRAASPVGGEADRVFGVLAALLKIALRLRGAEPR
jgi:hypothetical protein